MLYSPATPTKAYITLLKIEATPNKLSTRLNWKKPMSPQLTAPMITSISMIASSTFNNITPFIDLQVLL